MDTTSTTTNTTNTTNTTSKFYNEDLYANQLHSFIIHLKSRGILQKSIAQQLNVSEASVSNFINGKTSKKKKAIQCVIKSSKVYFSNHQTLLGENVPKEIISLINGSEVSIKENNDKDENQSTPPTTTTTSEELVENVKDEEEVEYVYDEITKLLIDLSKLNISKDKKEKIFSILLSK